jgi:hypothetical protein
MKFISKLFNLILLCVTFCAMSLTEWCVYNTVMAADSDSYIGIKSTERNVSYFDMFRWYGDDLSQSVGFSQGVEPRYDVRSWFGNDDWQKNMKWADYAIEAVIGVTTPIFAPVYEAKELSNYRLKDKSDEFIYVSMIPSNGSNTVSDSCEYKYGTWNGLGNFDEHAYAEVLYKPCVYTKKNDNDPDPSIYTVYTGKTVTSTIDDNKEDIMDKARSVISFNDENGNIVKEYRKIYKWSSYANTEDAGYEKYDPKWYHVQHKIYNEYEWKINKYNSSVYDKWVDKYFHEVSGSEYGDIAFKTSVPSLYFQFYLAIILSIWFVVQNPIIIKRTPDGAEEMSGGLRNLFVSRSDRERKLQQEEADGRRWHHVFHFHHKKKDGKAKI